MTGLRTILLLDGDLSVLKAVSHKLTEEGYRVLSCNGVQAARRILSKTAVDAVVMEPQLPEGSGLEFLYEVKLTMNIPVVFYTALCKVEDICTWLRAGANDYMIKPIDLNLFAARLTALLLTYQGGRESFYLPPLRLNFLRQIAFADDVDLLLTPKEFSLLYLLAQNCGKTLSRALLSRSVWGTEDDIGNALDKNISRLKKKLMTVTDKVIIDTSYNGGYSMTIVSL
jgi:DNA-binding response OmpR family regulator